MHRATKFGRLHWYKIALGAILVIFLGLWLAPYFAGTKVISPYLLETPLTLRWYGLTMALALAAGIGAVLRYRLDISKLSDTQLLSVIIWNIVGGFIGARLLFVLLKWPLYANDLGSIVRVNEGGLSLHGALLGGLIATLVFCYRHQINWRLLADQLVIGLPIAQAVGRFGNFFNQEAFGGPTNLPWKMYIEPAMRPQGLEGFDFFHPTFLYEAILNLGIFYYLIRYQPPAYAGRNLGLYLMLYSCVRFVLEFFRVDSDHLGIFSVAQWASIAIIAITALWMSRLPKTKP